MLKLAIDFGSSVTKIYKIGSGTVLAEATCVTVQKDTVRTGTTRSGFSGRPRI